MNSPSQEMHHGNLMSNLNQGRKQHDTGQWEEAQNRSRVMMIVHLHKDEEGLSSHTPEK
jgi:hypothetical protein